MLKISFCLEDCQNNFVYGLSCIILFDIIHHLVRDNVVICNLAAFVILGINTKGKKQFLRLALEKMGAPGIDCLF